MTDLERKLQSLLRARARGLKPLGTLSPRTVRRARVRQGAVAAATGALALSIAVAAFVGVRSLTAAPSGIDPVAPKPTQSESPDDRRAGQVEQSPRPKPTTPPPGSLDPPRYPPPVADLEHGGTYFGVYFEVVRGTDARKGKITQAARAVRGLGFEPSVGDVNCDRGAKEALGLAAGRNYVAVALYFHTQEQARRFVDAYKPEVVGVARVTTGCLD